MPWSTQSPRPSQRASLPKAAGPGEGESGVSAGAVHDSTPTELTVNLVEVDRVLSEPRCALLRRFDHGLAALPPRQRRKLGGDGDVLGRRLLDRRVDRVDDVLAEQLFGPTEPVHLGRVEESDARLDAVLAHLADFVVELRVVAPEERVAPRPRSDADGRQGGPAQGRGRGGGGGRPGDRSAAGQKRARPRGRDASERGSAPR